MTDESIPSGALKMAINDAKQLVRQLNRYAYNQGESDAGESWSRQDKYGKLVRATEDKVLEAIDRLAALASPSPATGALKVADPIDSDEHPIWIAIIGWLNSEGSDASVAAVNAAIKAECAKREAKPVACIMMRVKDGLATKGVSLYEAHRDLPLGTVLCAKVEPEDNHG